MEIVELSCHYCGAPSKQQKYCCSACELLDKGFEQLSQVKNQNNNSFTYLDLEENQKLYRLNDTTRAFKFYIEGIQCSSCVHLLEKIPDYNPDCINSRLNIGTSELYVELTEHAKLSQIADLIKNMGYDAQIIKSSEDIDEKIKKEQRNDLKRIAVAGAVAGNIMLFSVSIYAGADGTLLEIFKWLSFVLFLPILFYVAIPFYRGAWTSLKVQKVHIDLPITIALVTSSIFSFYNLVIGSDQFYFDSTASFIFLILVARFFVKKTQQRFLAPQNIKSQIKNESYALTSGQIVLPENIKQNDRFIVSQDQIIPVDGYLEADTALIDTSFMSGESVPYAFTRGMKVFAGYKILSSSVVIVCEKPILKTRLSELLGQSFQNLILKNNFLNLADKLSEKLILTVFIIAGLFFVSYGYFVDLKEAFDRSLALIVVACPCALAFGSPLTMAMAYKKAQKKGISVRDPNVFEKLDQIQNIFFDKTGTLTYGQLNVCETWPEEISKETANLLINLESVSYHPVAFAIRSYFKTDTLNLPIKQHEEVFGIGVRGIIDNDYYELKALPANLHSDEIDMAVALYKNKEIQCRIYFQDKLREESKSIIQYLSDSGKNCFLVSGDKKRKALHVGSTCGIPQDRIFSELYPEDKKDIVAKYPHSLMIGDGVNDSLALSQSEVSVALKGSAEIALSSSDIFFMKSGLRPLLDLFSIHNSIHSTLRRNLSISLFYNASAGVLALFGFINPLYAAVLMPVSSVIILGSTLWGLKT